MRVVINTNVLLVSISPRSKYHWIFEGLKSERFDLLISTEILFEYQEIVEKKYSIAVARLLLDTLDVLPNVHEVTPRFCWNLITQDPDDDKFSDCAIAGNADHLVTEDSDFNTLKSIEFPKISVLNIREFQNILFHSG